MIGTDLPVRIRRRTPAQIAVSIEADDWSWYANFSEHPLHDWVRHNGTDGSQRNWPFLLVLDDYHTLQLPASRFTVAGPGLIPTGEIASVEETPFDFLQPTRIGDRIDADDPQIKLGLGYDHNYVLDRSGAPPWAAGRVVAPRAGRVLEDVTTEPGVQLYSGNHMDGKLAGKGGKVYPRRGGFCLETQHYPDTPNRPEFPSTVLRPGEKYATSTIYRFSVERR